MTMLYIFEKSIESSITISLMATQTIAGIDNYKEYFMTCSLSSSSFLFLILVIELLQLLGTGVDYYIHINRC